MRFLAVLFTILFAFQASFGEAIRVPVEHVVRTDQGERQHLGQFVIQIQGDSSPATPFPKGTQLLIYHNGQEIYVEVLGHYTGAMNGYAVKDVPGPRRVTQINFDDELISGGPANTIVMKDEFFTAEDFIESAQGALIQGAVAGLSVLLYQGLIYDSDFRKTYAEYQRRKEQLRNDKKEMDAALQKKVLEGFTSFEKSLLQVDLLGRQLSPQAPVFDFSRRAPTTDFRSRDPRFVQELRDIRSTVDSVPKYDPRSLNLKRAAYDLTELADQAHAENNLVDAQAYKKYALATADLLFGIDPLTGTFRAVYEGFSGFNFVTGEKLSAFERGFAVAGMVSFGYGNKISQGLKGLHKIAGKAFNKDTFSRSVRFAQQTFHKVTHLNTYLAKRLWRTERWLLQENPKLLSQIRAKKNSTDYLRFVQERQSFRISHPYDKGKFIEQEMSIEALEAIERIEKKGQIARQGEFEWELGKIRDELRAGDLSPQEIKNRLKGSKIQTVLEPNERSIFYGEVTDDLGSAAYANRYGTFAGTTEFVEIFNMPQGTPFLTRKAPPGRRFDPKTKSFTQSPGGGIEALVPSQNHLEPAEFWIIDGHRNVYKFKGE